MSSLKFRKFRILRPHYTIEVQDFRLDPGQSLELRAPSGFGKTSVLRALLGLAPHEGEVLFGKTRLHEVPVHRRRIGMVFQDQVLFTHLSTIQNVMSGMRLQGFSKSRSQKLALEGLESFGLRERANARVGELSGGERQRVAILRATLWKPSILVLDEPFQGLDQDNRDRIRQYITRFVAEHPVPMIWIDHQGQFEGLQLIGRTHAGETSNVSERRVFHLT